MKVRTLLVAGAAAAAVLVPALAAHAAGPATSCPTTAPNVLAGATTAPLPDGGKIFAEGTQVPPSGAVGISGPGGYLYALGSPATGGTIQGTTQAGLSGHGAYPWLNNTANGYLKVSSSPGICLQVGGHGVSAP